MTGEDHPGASLSDGPDVSDLGRRVKRGLTMSLSISWVERLWIFLLGVAIARGLTVQDFAAFGAALAFVGVLITADDLGMLAGLVNHRRAIEPLAPTAMTLSLCSGFTLCAAYMAAAPWIADVFGVPDQTTVFRIMGLAILTDAAGDRSQRRTPPRHPAEATRRPSPSCVSRCAPRSPFRYCSRSAARRASHGASWRASWRRACSPGS